MKYVEFNKQLLVEIDLLTNALDFAVTMTSCLGRASNKDNWNAAVEKQIQRVKEAQKANKKELLKEAFYLDDKKAIEQNINIIKNKNSKLFIDQINYLVDAYNDFCSRPISYVEQDY